jgi:alpha-maltose-1-phosphate synthase
VGTGPVSGTGSRIAMVVYGDIAHDSRVQREATTLAEAGYEVTLFCLASPQGDALGLDPRIEVIARNPSAAKVVPGSPSPFRRAPGGRRLIALWRRATWLWGYVRNLRAWGGAIKATRRPFDVWHAHDFAGLVAVGRPPRGSALVYDVHDLFVEAGTASLLPGFARSLIRRYERWLVRRVDLVVAVNGSLAEVVARRCSPRSMIVVHNCPPRWMPPSEPPDLIRSAAGIPAGRPVVLYHGVLASSRGIATLAEAILEPGLETAHLALLGYGEQRDSLIDMARSPRFGGRVHVLDPVAPSELLPWVASADVASMALPRLTLNLYLSTPNKLFEALAANVPVVVSDFPAVREIVIDDPLGPLGVVCDPADVHDVARAIREILALPPDAASDLRGRCGQAARERWNWETESAKIVAAYSALPLAGRPPA